MIHSWVTNFLLSVPFLLFSGFTTFLTFYFVSAVLFGLLCSPFSSHFLFQKLLSKSLLSFSQLINLPFTFSSPHLSTSTCPLVFLWSIHTWAPERLQAEHPWGRRSGGPGPYGWEPEGSQPSWEISSALCLIPHLPTVPSCCLWTAGTSCILPDRARCFWDKAPADAPLGLIWEPLWAPVSAPLWQRWLWRQTRCHSSVTKPQHLGYKVSSETNVQPENKNRNHQE